MTDAVLISLISGSVTLVVAAIAGLINYKVGKLKQAQNETHMKINSRMDELLTIYRELERAKGMQEGEQKGRADNIKEQSDRDSKIS